MLVFATRPEGLDYQYESWNVGKEFPAFSNLDDLVSIAASDEELDTIKTVFPTFPHPTTDMVIYPGDVGRFIYLNMKVYYASKP
jgi:hypothetical protein